jgi:hypothetical protein
MFKLGRPTMKRVTMRVIATAALLVGGMDPHAIGANRQWMDLGCAADLHAGDAQVIREARSNLS